MSNDVSVVKEHLNIVDVVGEYVRLTKAGVNYKARCPFHEEKTPSFVVTEDRQSYHCFGCGKGGDVLSFVMEMENLEFPEALKVLADRAGVELQKYTPEQKTAHDQKSRLYDVIDLSVKFYEKQLWNGDDGAKILAYLHSRGIEDDILKKFHVGYAPEGWNHIQTFLTGRKCVPQDMTQAGLLIAKEAGGYYDRFRSRVMFPISDPLGRTIGYSARVAPGSDESQAKYINTPESPLYHKSDVLYGIDLAKQAIKKADRVIIVEGNMDVIAAHQAGIENTVAISGTAMTASHIQVLKRYTTNFTLFFDADDAGQKAAAKSALTCFAADINLSLVSLDGGKDAADLVVENPEELRKVVAQAKNAFTYFIEQAKKTYDITNPREKRQAVEEVLTYAAAMPHPVERDAWITKCAQALDVREEDATQIVTQMLAVHEPRRSSRAARPPIEPAVKKENLLDGVQPVIVQLLLVMLAFPDVWKYADAKKQDYDFWEKITLASTMMREGPEHSFSGDAFIAAAPERAALYTQMLSTRESFESTHEDEEARIHFATENMLRAQAEYNRRKLTFYIQKKGQAEKCGDTQALAHYRQKIAELNIS